MLSSFVPRVRLSMEIKRNLIQSIEPPAKPNDVPNTHIAMNTEGVKRNLSAA